MPHYKITEEIRHHFARPWGTLVPVVDGDKDLTAKKVFELIRGKSPNSTPIIITIGDVVTDSFCIAKIPLKIAIIDGRTKRGYFSGKTGIFDAFKTVKNPAGEITDAAWSLIREVISSGISTLISVDGEEDLLVIPVVIESPNNTFVVYGQPPKTDADVPIPEGVVFLEVTPELKSKIQMLMSKLIIM